MVKDNQQDVKDFNTEAQSAQDPNLQQAAKMDAPVLAEHLQAAEQIAQTHNVEPRREEVGAIAAEIGVRDRGRQPGRFRCIVRHSKQPGICWSLSPQSGPPGVVWNSHEPCRGRRRAAKRRLGSSSGSCSPAVW